MHTIPTIKRLPTRLSTYDIEGMTISERRILITIYMIEHFYGNEYWCESLGCYVVVSKKSCKETAHHASKHYESTIAAINLPTIIRHSVLWDSHKPKLGRQSKEFYAIRMYELRIWHNTLGMIKLMIAKKKNRIYIEYCVTATNIKRLLQYDQSYKTP